MKKVKILFSLGVIALGIIAVTSKSAEAQCDYGGKKQVVAISCKNAAGEIIGYGNSCDTGSNECTANPCG